MIKEYVNSIKQIDEDSQRKGFFRKPSIERRKP